MSFIVLCWLNRSWVDAQGFDCHLFTSSVLGEEVATSCKDVLVVVARLIWIAQIVLDIIRRSLHLPKHLPDLNVPIASSIDFLRVIELTFWGFNFLPKIFQLTMISIKLNLFQAVQQKAQKNILKPRQSRDRQCLCWCVSLSDEIPDRLFTFSYRARAVALRLSLQSFALFRLFTL